MRAVTRRPERFRGGWDERVWRLAVITCASTSTSHAHAADCGHAAQTCADESPMEMTHPTAEQTRWMRGPSAALRGALLGLLLERPGHGADLANRLIARLGETWRVDSNDVYRLLEQLESHALAVSRNQSTRGKRQRTKLVYHPTWATAEALTLWMETLQPHEPVRLAWQAKLAVARPQDAPRLLNALHAYQRECLLLATTLSPTREQEHSWATLCMDCSREAVLAQLSAEAEWAARTRRRIKAAGRSIT